MSINERLKQLEDAAARQQQDAAYAWGREPFDYEAYSAIVAAEVERVGAEEHRRQMTEHLAAYLATVPPKRSVPGVGWVATTNTDLSES